MKKRVLAIAMSLAMTLSLMPASALATETGETPEEETQPASLTQETNGSEGQDQEITVDVEIDEDTQVTVGDSVENPVAKIGETGYETLQAAIEDAEDGDTVTLTADATGGAVTFSKSGKFVLDLNNHVFTSTDAYDVIMIKSKDVDLTIQDGTLEGHGTATYGIYVYALDTDGDKKVDVTCDNVTVTLDNVDLDVTDQGLGVQGLNRNNNLIVKNSSVSAGTAIYFPPKTGSLIIEDSNITGIDNAIVIKGGEVEISGNSIVRATGKPEEGEGPYEGDPDHPETFPQTGSAIYVEGGYVSDAGGARPINVNIYGGTFISENSGAIAVDDAYLAEDEGVQTIQITGGTFSTDVSKYIPSGMTWNEETHEVEISDDAVASVKGIPYDDLQEAINAAGNGDTVKLLKETTSEAPITISKGQRFTLDLGGYTLTVSGTQAVQDEQAFGEDKVTKTAIVNNGTLTIANGTIITTADCNSITNTGTLEITQDTVLSNSYDTYSGRNLIVNLGGTVTTAGQLTSAANNGICTYGGNIAVTGGTISATHFQDWSNFASGITIFNRSYDNNSTGATVTISGGTIEAAIYAASTNNVYSGGKSPSNLTITGGTLTATKSTAIYWPSAGTLTIGTEDSVGGPTINSERGSAVEICSGTLNVYGGTLNGGTKMTEGDSYPTNQDLVDGYRVNSGSAGTGDAVTVISRRGSGYDTASLTVNIAGGTFNSPKNYGVRYMDCNLATEADQKKQDVQVEITGGNFDGGIAAVEAEFTEKEDKDFISGGSYSDSVLTYLTNKVNAELQRATGNTPFSYYETIEEASANVQPGDTVTALNATTTDPCTVTINYGYGSNSIIQVASGTTISLPSPGTRTGYTFNGWYNGSSYVGREGTEVTITSNIIYTASWTPIQSDRPSGSGSSSSDSGDYLISVDRVSGGRVTVQPGRADKGDTVTITVYPNDGYELDELVVTDSRGNEIDLDARSATRFTFTMPGGKVTVEASFVREGGQTQTPQTTFADVPASAWYYNAVEYVYENGLMSGVSGGRFAPDDTLTRAMLVQTLYAMEGRPAAASAGFADVASGDWYASAVNWAAANGVVSGVSETGFGPNNALTREQLALILYRFAQYKGYDVTGTSDLAAYADGSSVSGWAAEAMGWAVDAGLISGVGGNQIAPTGTASRAQVAQILMNFCENVAR